jgi:hypothetical protein
VPLKRILHIVWNHATEAHPHVENHIIDKMYPTVIDKRNRLPRTRNPIVFDLYAQIVSKVSPSIRASRPST